MPATLRAGFGFSLLLRRQFSCAKLSGHVTAVGSNFSWFRQGAFVDGNPKGRNRRIEIADFDSCICIRFLGGVPESSAGNVANTQPHASRLIRAGTPPSSCVYRHPVRIKRVGLGCRGKAPARLRSRRWGFGAQPRLLLVKTRISDYRHIKNVSISRDRAPFGKLRARPIRTDPITAASSR